MEVKITLSRDDVQELGRREYTRITGQQIPFTHGVQTSEHYGQLVIELYEKPPEVKPCPIPVAEQVAEARGQVAAQSLPVSEEVQP
jgi:hypothetical protein